MYGFILNKKTPYQLEFTNTSGSSKLLPIGDLIKVVSSPTRSFDNDMPAFNTKAYTLTQDILKDQVEEEYECYYEGQRFIIPVPKIYPFEKTDWSHVGEHLPSHIHFFRRDRYCGAPSVSETFKLLWEKHKLKGAKFIPRYIDGESV